MFFPKYCIYWHNLVMKNLVSFMYLENLQPITSEIYGIASNMPTLRKVNFILFFKSRFF